jgi:hypothetical protein
MSGGELTVEQEVVMFVSLCLLLGGIFRTFKQKFNFVYTPCLLIAGIFISYYLDETQIK